MKYSLAMVFSMGVIGLSLVVGLSFASANQVTNQTSQTSPTANAGQTVAISGVLVGPISGPGGDTTGMAIYDQLNGNFIAEVHDNSNSAARFVVGPCSTTYQPVLVTGEFKMEDLGPEAPNVKVLEIQSIAESGPRLRQDIRPAIADGLCPFAQGHAAFVDLEASYPHDRTGVDNGASCAVKVNKTDLALTIQVQSSTGGTQSCTLNDNDPRLTETRDDFSTYFSNGSLGTFATPQACGVTTMTARGKTMVFISTSNDSMNDSMASCTLK